MMRSFCLALLLLGSALCAQDTIQVQQQEAWHHRIAPVRSIHAKLPPTSFRLDTIKLLVVVDAEGNVESAQPVSGPAEFFTQAEDIEYKRKFKPFARDGIPVRASLEDYVSILPPEEWLETSVPFPDVKDWNSLRMRLKRTSCYGACPDYSVEVSGNGDVEFNGIANVFISGHHRAKISAEALHELVAAFRRANYLWLKNSYHAMITDLPTYSTSIEFDGLKKSVVDYGGPFIGMPEAVRDLEDTVDRIAGTETWIKGNSQTGAALISEKWNFQADTTENQALFAQIVASKSEELIQLFLNNGAPVLSMTKDDQGPLISAASNGNLELVQRMLGAGSLPLPSVLTCALGAAAKSGNLELVDFLLLKGADPNGPPCGRDGYLKASVLMQATESGKAEVVERILKYHPSVDPEGPMEVTPLTWFLQRAPAKADTQRIINLLVAAGVDVNKLDHNGQTPLGYACYKPEAMRALIAAGADVNAKAQYGLPVLMSCVDKTSLKILIESGADLNFRNREGLTAAQAARQMGLTDIAELLEAAMKQRGSGTQH
jgi:ankyrin repeat protein